MLLQVPAPGEVLAVTAAAGGAYAVDPAAQGLGLEMAWRGDDLVLAFAGAGSIRLQGAAGLVSADSPPLVVLPDGTEVGVDRLYAMLDMAAEGAPLETAAGPDAAADGAAPDGGFRGYSDYQGEASIAGLAATGALGEQPASGPFSFDTGDDRGLDGGTAGVSAGAGGATAASGTGDSGSEASGSEASGSEDSGSGNGNGNGNGNGKSQAQSDDDSHGKSGDDELTGGDGDDHLVGGADDDTLDGGAGDDTLNGGAGNDLLNGGLGDDDLQGGSGADIFLFDFSDGAGANGGGGGFGTDTVRDFDPGAGDVLSFANVIAIDSSSGDAELGDLLSTISEVADNGRDVTIEFDSGGVVVLEGFGTGGIDSVTDLLNEIAEASVDVA